MQTCSAGLCTAYIIRKSVSAGRACLVAVAVVCIQMFAASKSQALSGLKATFVILSSLINTVVLFKNNWNAAAGENLFHVFKISCQLLSLPQRKRSMRRAVGYCKTQRLHLLEDKAPGLFEEDSELGASRISLDTSQLLCLAKHNSDSLCCSSYFLMLVTLSLSLILISRKQKMNPRDNNKND